MPAKHTRSDDTGLAFYWFAKLVDALKVSDYILVTAAQEQLRGFGFEVGPTEEFSRRVLRGRKPLLLKEPCDDINPLFDPD
jgi:hypothetical protein